MKRRRGEIRMALRDLAGGASVEIAPHRLPPADALARDLPRGTSVYVPFLPKARWRETPAACERLLEAGMRPVPHLPARMVSGPDKLANRLSGLADAGVDSLMLVAGDRATPAGPYGDTLALLDSGLPARHGFTRIGVAAHPEGHPLVPQADLDEALRRKAEYAARTGAEMWMVTQFVFSPAPALAWLARMRDTGCALPVRIGIAGPARVPALLGYAVRCGVGASLRTLRGRPGTARLMGRWSPDALARALARHLAQHEDTPLAGIHLFTFGGLSGTSEWLRGLRLTDGGDPAREPG